MKHLLTSLAFLPLAAFAQVPEADMGTDQMSDTRIPAPSQEKIQSAQTSPLDHTIGDITSQLMSRSQEVITFQPLDTTIYDLQSNASMGRRIKVYPDGRISAVWTHGLNESRNYPDRGTGYNHFNGNEWVVNNVSRLEDTRSGWPNLGTFGSGSNQYEFTLTHIAGDDQEGTGGYVFSQNNEVGNTNFTNEVRQAGDGPIWWRTATAGDNLYMLGTYSGNSDLGGDTVKQGIRFPTVFYRSTDRGQTFEDSNILLPGYADTSERLFGSADGYAIDAQDSVVAAVISEGNRSLTLWKSTDSGKTWKEQVIRELDISTERYRNGLWGLDTVPNPDGPGQAISIADTTNDGSVSTVIDETGTVHVTWGNRAAGRDDTTQQTGVFSFLLGPNVIQYWNDEDEKIVNAGDAPTITSSPSGQTTNYTTGQNAAPYNTAASSRPSIAFSNKDTLFIVYEAAVNNTVRINNDYRDLYVVYSTDGGSSWSEALNITQTADNGGESAFASVNKEIVNDKLHLIWQEDVFPGVSVGRESTQNTVSDNSILYASVSTDDILSDSLISQASDTTSDSDSTSSVFNRRSSDNGQLSVYPNPVQSNDVVKAELSLQNPANVEYKVVNTVGQVQFRKELGKVAAGKRHFRIDNLDLSKGVYFLQFEIDDRTITRKVLSQ
jgi:hypothetical protein